MPSNALLRHPLVGLVDEIARLNGRLKSSFADTRRSVGLNESEMMVLNSVVEAGRPPTVPQIGRSLGHPRQLVQRAANALVEAGLIASAPNPDHKRAALLQATPAGIALKDRADSCAAQLAESLSAGLDLVAVRDVTQRLHGLREQLEMQLRADRAPGEGR